MIGHVESLAVRTANGDTFTGEETIRLAFLVAKRFGFKTDAAAAAWRRMLNNDCSDEDFATMATLGRHAKVK